VLPAFVFKRTPSGSGNIPYNRARATLVVPSHDTLPFIPAKSLGSRKRSSTKSRSIQRTDKSNGHFICLVVINFRRVPKINRCKNEISLWSKKALSFENLHYFRLRINRNSGSTDLFSSLSFLRIGIRLITIIKLHYTSY